MASSLFQKSRIRVFWPFACLLSVTPSAQKACPQCKRAALNILIRGGADLTPTVHCQDLRGVRGHARRKRVSSKARSSPALSGTGEYENDLGRAIGCSMCHRTFNSLCRVISNAGWVGVPTTCQRQESNQLKRKRHYTQQDFHQQG